MRSVRQIIYGKTPGFEYHELIREANRYPRYTLHRFHFNNYYLSVTDFLSVAWQLKEIFLDEQMNFLSSKESPFIIDCGSNAGISILYFKKIYPKSRILCFEPDESLMKVLRENIFANKIEGVETIEKAIWTNDAGVDFGSDGADGGSVFLESNKIHVPSIRLKDILRKEKEVDFLKMDIEGAEVEVLSDCAEDLKKVHHLFVEYHSWASRPQQLDKLLSILTSAGLRYYIQTIGETGVNPLIKKRTENEMDVQLNIYATKI